MYTQKAEFFDSQTEAPWAADEYGPEEAEKLNRLFSITGSLDGMAVLEPGCGTGRLTEILSERVGPSGRVLALDISAKMVDVAGRRVEGLGNVEVHQAELEGFSFVERSFDLILCHQVFPHLEEKEKALKILAGVLKPEGMIVVVHFISFAQINNVHRKAGTAVEKDMMPGEDEMKRLFAAAGLTIDFIKNNSEGYFLCAKKM